MECSISKNHNYSIGFLRTLFNLDWLLETNFFFFFWSQKDGMYYSIKNEGRNEPSLQSKLSAVAIEWAIELPDCVVKVNNKETKEERRAKRASNLCIARDKGK